MEICDGEALGQETIRCILEVLYYSGTGDISKITSKHPADKKYENIITLLLFARYQ